jgi:hypothetical protein
MNTKQNISLIEKAKIEMTSLVRIIRLFEIEFGQEKVKNVLLKDIQNELSSIKEWEDADVEAEISFLKNFSSQNNLEYEIISKKESCLEYKATKCSFAKLMKELSAEDIGKILICDPDYCTYKKLGFELTRKQTIMEGAEYCDFKLKALTKQCT